MFIGEYQHSLDSKNRIIVPSKLREGLGDKFIISKGLDGCLYAYPIDEWQKFEEKLKNLPLTNRDARAFVRFFVAGATEVETDKQGRGLIPANLREYAGIEKEIVTIGALNKVEIWSKEKWESYNESDIDFDSIADKMGDLGI
ncbi:division/cell wall cluster transcriptional repressor MraZ [Clostridium sp. NSJ-6]|uniref:Transcriptional regulator MraZ n=1 Tax=Clostridium hominis TaxID=2763036 RepID=A0ABR7D7W6_9CLOT|nr:division/cell wall cluster transcriptional repressor MraZ [Clostridium hominis]MBC5627481.1 division/cell wall cluster transcriptional repressor MraZ [Clostridium hominis]MDU2672539.1 division/cell wall cluster transcriptional repressor MraZ [Clostridium sp.]